jgi:hypothetical protein
LLEDDRASKEKPEREQPVPEPMASAVAESAQKLNEYFMMTLPLS